MDDAKDTTKDSTSETLTPSDVGTVETTAPTTTGTGSGNGEKKPIKIGKPVIESGIPQLRKTVRTGGKTAKWKPIIDMALKLQKNHHIRVPVEDTTDETRCLHALKAAIKKYAPSKGLRAALLSNGVGIIKD